MSRYFDLMQQAGMTEGAFAGSRTDHATEAVQASTDIEDLDAYGSHRGSLNDAARGEILDLVQRIFLIPAESPPRVVVFASVDEQRDASQICASVARTLARVSKRPVCLVEANFRSPNLSAIFGAANRHGLADALTVDKPIDSFCQPTTQEYLWLLPSGALDADSPSLLTPDSLKSRFTELRDSFEFVIVHGAPLAGYAETLILGRVTDGLALVLEAGSTRREAAATAMENLRSSNIPIVAAVLNKGAAPTSKKFFR